ncbi:hypothetical protein GOP47_0000120 [Adiantum capillus-veneris]|uniref:Uncharacterized protein n=1 Tax=Adiantum capillus-veneris TaxID=13818 RepID=A0A9D4ZS33_ADICA|nr:hypothetical protein GOP47_0000120 [Adiantum capillus-veneris]
MAELGSFVCIAQRVAAIGYTERAHRATGSQGDGVAGLRGCLSEVGGCGYGAAMGSQVKPLHPAAAANKVRV